MNPSDVDIYITEYTVGNSSIKIVWRDKDSWAIIDVGMVLNKFGDWEYESNPSNRDYEFIERTRYDLMKAKDIARQAYIDWKLRNNEKNYLN